MSSLCLMVLSLGLGQNYDRAQWRLVPQFNPGVELVYRGTCTEKTMVPGVQHERHYDLEMILLMQSQDKETHFGNAVLQTSLALRQPRGLAGKENLKVPGSVRLDLVQIAGRGALHARKKAASRARSLDEMEPTQAIPLDGPPVQETGAFFEMPLSPVSLHDCWEQLEEQRPLRRWELVGVEPCLHAHCLKLHWTQQSADWNEPRADSTAWRRRETIWFAYQAGQVFRLERIIERRDPGRTEPTRSIVTKYDLENRFRYADEPGSDFGGRLYEDRVEEISKFLKFQEEAAPLLEQPARFRQNIDALLKRISSYMENNSPNPYRKALVYLKNKLDRARSGELPIHPRVAAPAIPSVQPLGIGQKVPNCLVAELTSYTAKNTHRFEDYLGQPTLVIYYDPTTEIGRKVLVFAQKLCEKYGEDLQVLGMAVSDDLALIRRQHEELELSFPILDGKAMIRPFGVDATPRVVLLDDAGLVRCAFTGWGYHSPAEVAGEIRRLLPKN